MGSTVVYTPAVAIALAALGLTGCAIADAPATETGIEAAVRGADTGMGGLHHGFRSDEGDEDRCTWPEDEVTVAYAGKICFKPIAGEDNKFEFDGAGADGACAFGGWQGPTEVKPFVDQHNYTLREIAFAATVYPNTCLERGCVPRGHLIRTNGDCGAVTCTLAKITQCGGVGGPRFGDAPR